MTSQQSKKLSERIENYLPSKSILSLKPTQLDLDRKRQYQKTRPGDTFVLVNYQQQLVIVPAWHPLNTTSKTANASQYATGSMESLSLEPVLDKQDEKNIAGGNIILLNSRIDRLYDRALPARNITLPMSRTSFSQGVIDLMSILGTTVMKGKNGDINRGSIRVSVAPGIGQFGKSAIGETTDVSVEAYFWDDYFPKRAYNGSGLIVSAGPHQRLTEFHGKHASHYGGASRIGKMAKEVGADEALIFAPYEAQKPHAFTLFLSQKDDATKLYQSLLTTAIADGLGEEILAVRKDNTILLPPMSINRLGGTTAKYIMDYMAPALGIAVEESMFSIEQILNKEITGLFFAGNASRIAAIGEIKVCDFQLKIIKDIHLDIPDIVRQLIDRFEAEVRSVIAPSDTSLITPIDLQEGEKAREKLEKIYTDWL